MTKTQTVQSLPEVLDALEALADDSGDVSLGAILDGVGARGYGPLMVVLSVFLVPPFGAVPGIPAIVGLLLVALGVQMLLPGRGLWVPARLRRLTFGAEVLQQTAERARPTAEWLDRILAPRLPALSGGPVIVRLVALVLIPTGATMMVIGFVPFLPLALGLHVVLLGLGILARNGVLVLLGFASLLPEILLALWLAG